jgi:hypothetical protein
LEDSTKYKTSNLREITVSLATKSNILPQKSLMKNTSNNMNKYKESDFMKNEFKYQAGILDAPFLKTEAMNKIYSN